MYLRLQTRTDDRELERGKKARRGHKGLSGQPLGAAINLPELQAAPDAKFPAQRAFVGGKIRTFNGKEWI